MPWLPNDGTSADSDLKRLENKKNISRDTKKKRNRFSKQDFLNENWIVVENWLGPHAPLDTTVELGCFDLAQIKQKLLAWKMEKQKRNKNLKHIVNPYHPVCSIFSRLENFEIDVVKYVNNHRSECIKAFEGNEKKLDELLHQLSQHGGKHALSYINCDMETSRTHQIRLQSQYLGLGVVGDKLYCRNEVPKHWDLQIEKLLFGSTVNAYEYNWNRNDFHAHHTHLLEFEHPTTKKRMDFHCPIPAMFYSILQQLQSIVKQNYE
ncbi:ribosomal large subunit pseudouridine synthase D [Reticulomyxa filosa]|uniref:Ribosomal large subunit pseudouridine synthase D n=1 Tax=Reticulomyxa filosa TaxID=46433 RepID=X6L9J2_RETFI|nr:ribosomal large subunit pseudouridine synthase D [Reticulomyxa filosa]|eukprot:ETN98020.1 ribosomal large subunit pseudouridine synthase D [Reticulomyxa filosa]